MKLEITTVVDLGPRTMKDVIGLAVSEKDQFDNIIKACNEGTRESITFTELPAEPKPEDQPRIIT